MNSFLVYAKLLIFPYPSILILVLCAQSNRHIRPKLKNCLFDVSNLPSNLSVVESGSIAEQKLSGVALILLGLIII